MENQDKKPSNIPSFQYSIVILLFSSELFLLFIVEILQYEKGFLLFSLFRKNTFAVPSILNARQQTPWRTKIA